MIHDKERQKDKKRLDKTTIYDIFDIVRKGRI